MNTEPDSIRLNIKVVPSASGDGIVGWLGDTLKVRVSAPPEKGKANKAVRALIARSLGISIRSVEIVAGDTSRTKRVDLRGVSAEHLEKVLGKADA